MNPKPTVGCVGLGAMGAGMAANILDAGYDLRVVAHRKRSAIDALVARGAEESENCARLAQASDVILLCLPDSEAVEQVVGQMSDALARRHVLIDAGTSSPKATAGLHASLARRGVAFAESPLTGGAEQARNAELGALVGAQDDVFERIKPLLETFCAAVEHFGPVGTAGRAKLISNHLVLGMVALAFDSFHAAGQAGIDWAQLYRIMLPGAGNSTALRRIIGNAVEGDFQGYLFSVSNACKDLRCIAELGDELALSETLDGKARELFAAAERLGYGDRVISELFRNDLREELVAEIASARH